MPTATNQKDNSPTSEHWSQSEDDDEFQELYLKKTMIQKCSPSKKEDETTYESEIIDKINDTLDKYDEENEDEGPEEETIIKEVVNSHKKFYPISSSDFDTVKQIIANHKEESYYHYYDDEDTEEKHDEDHFEDDRDDQIIKTSDTSFNLTFPSNNSKEAKICHSNDKEHLKIHGYTEVIHHSEEEDDDWEKDEELDEKLNEQDEKPKDSEDDGNSAEDYDEDTIDSFYPSSSKRKYDHLLRFDYSEDLNSENNDIETEKDQEKTNLKRRKIVSSEIKRSILSGVIGAIIGSSVTFWSLAKLGSMS
ncbi:hypothetical protein WICMUC_003662 [Wickerhamomyces mucosus]|uniref:Uncharacterized protein n=1 Tax=Wickerhamomyces mucosus TaxID=1378264 RepID=A0A9P8PL41_9ASCO|nr:hypothetical protein WICMUC_003662 [Wickerhamomyces mucosus]